MVEKASALLRKAKRPLALAGAGLSAESGVPTFRGAGGMWGKFKAQDLATPQAFARQPHVVWEWYAQRRDQAAALLPNLAHHALVKIEQHWPAFWLVTQNVDGLSQRAGSKRVIELHGSIWTIRCAACGLEFTDLTVPTPREHTCTDCRTGLLRPGVVWFHEELPAQAVTQTQELIEQCDLLFVLGTSAQVYPAAGYVPLAARAGATIVEINPDETPMSFYATLTFRQPVGQVLPQIVARALT